MQIPLTNKGHRDTGFRNITEAVDTTTSAGRMVMQMLGSFAEFERSMVRERTRAGLAAARNRGARLGRPAKLSLHQQQEVIKAVRDGSKTAADAARLFGLHRSNITRLLERIRQSNPPSGWSVISCMNVTVAIASAHARNEWELRLQSPNDSRVAACRAPSGYFFLYTEPRAQRFSSPAPYQPRRSCHSCRRTPLGHGGYTAKHWPIPHERSSNSPSMNEQTILLSELQKSFEQNVFIMMRYRSTDHFKEIEANIRQALSKYGLIARLAKDAALSDDLWENIQHYMRYCRFGIAVFEEIDEREFNPNISLELGYMYALKRRCLLLKDRRMPRLPTDTCGKIYRDFDTYRLSDSLVQQISDWCKRDLSLSERSAADPAQPLGALIFDSDTEDPDFRDWGVYDTTCQFEQHIRLVSTQGGDDSPGASYSIQISATASESVGVNKKLATLFGRARFAYKALESKAKVINVYFSMIPMQSEQAGDSLLEVGGNRRDDPDTAYSPYRKRYYVPHDHIGDEAWHEAQIEFDFRDLPTAAYSIFAARINEGSPKPGAGKLLIRSIKVFSYEHVDFQKRRTAPLKN